MYRLTLLWLALLAAPALAVGQSTLEVAGVPADVPFTVTARATGALLAVELRLEPEWHAYARDVGGGQPVRLTVDEGCGFVAAGALAAPDDGHGKLLGEVRLTLPIVATGAGGPLRARLELQVCDALQCLEPMTVQISGRVPPLGVLLVVASRGERAERIAAMLRGRGLAVEVTTYGEVSADACEASDLVIADSDVFGQHGVGLDLVRGFPRSTTPLIAVGFLGTELVEAHGLAMTSGYI